MTKANGPSKPLRRPSAHPSFQLYPAATEAKQADEQGGAVIVPQEELERRRALRRPRSTGDSIA